MNKICKFFLNIANRKLGNFEVKTNADYDPNTGDIQIVQLLYRGKKQIRSESIYLTKDQLQAFLKKL